MVIYEPAFSEVTFFNSKVLSCLDEFKEVADVFSNRVPEDKAMWLKIFTRIGRD